jgi:diguanylate cyclase (GGDEF)-like protein
LNWERGTLPAAGPVEARIRGEQVHIIYEQAPPALLISALVAGLLCFVLWHVADHRLLAGWFTLIGLLALARFTLVLRFRRRRPEARDMSAWEQLFVASLVSTGLAWGVGGWLIMPSHSRLHQVIVYFFLMGMAGGAVASYSAHATCTSVTIGSVMLPATVWFVLQDDVILRAMAVGGLVYIGAVYRATRTLAFFLRRSFQLTHELQEAHEAAQELARTDVLTGMKNRRAFYELGELAFEQAKRYGHPLSLVMLDVDRFKQVNDNWGHAAGDQVLKAVAGVIKETARASDISGRLGGEEFAVLLPETAVEDATAQAERLRRGVAGLSVRYEADDITLTCSLGVAQSDGECSSLDTLIGRADCALYEAKGQGRNRVAQHESRP